MRHPVRLHRDPPSYERRNWWFDSWFAFHWRAFTWPHQTEAHPWWRQA